MYHKIKKNKELYFINLRLFKYNFFLGITLYFLYCTIYYRLHSRLKIDKTLDNVLLLKFGLPSHQGYLTIQVNHREQNTITSFFFTIQLLLLLTYFTWR